MEKNFFKTFTTYLVTYHLLAIPPFIHAQEQEKEPLPSSPSRAQQLLMGIPNLVREVGKNIIGNQGKQGKQSTPQKNTGQKAKPPQENPFRPQTSTSKYFPECQVPMAVSPIPPNACAYPPAPGDQAGLQALQQWLGLTGQYESHFRIHAADNQNTRNAPEAMITGGPPSIGASCLNDALKRRQDQLQGSINEINEMIAQMKRADQEAKRQLEEAMNNIQDTAHVLYGNRNEGPNAKGKNFHALFSPGCQELIGTENLASAKSSGLTGLRDQVLSTPQQMANRFTNSENRQGHIEDIRGQLEQLKQEIERYGMEAWEPNYQSILGVGKTNYPGIERAMQREKVKIDREINKVREDLKTVGFELPKADHQFRDRMTAFAQSSKGFFERKFIESCFNRNPSFGQQSILERLRHNSTGNRGTVLINYRNALKEILESNTSMEQKIQDMQSLDASYGAGAVTLRTQSASGSGSFVPPYALFREQINRCRGEMYQDSASSNAAGIESMAVTIDKSDQSIKQALKLERSFASEFYNSLYDEIVNCSGQSVKTSTCNLNQAASVLEPSGENFCVGHATECGTRINACHASTSQIIQEYESKRDAEAARYNTTMQQLERSQKALLDQVKTKVMTLAQEVNKQLAGTQIEWPQDLVIEETQESIVEGLGVKLKGGGQLDILEQVPQKMQLLINSMQQQKAAAIQEMNDYIQKQKKGWGEEARRWAELKQKCQQVFTAYQKGLQDHTTAQNEQLQQAQNFCLKYDSLRQNPCAGCDSVDELFADAMTAVAFINPEALDEINQFKYHCKTCNNEALPYDGNPFSPSSDLNPADRFLDSCEENDDDWAQILDDMKSRALDAIPVQDFNDEDYQAIVESIEDNSKIVELDREIKRTPFGRFVLSNLKRFHDLENSGGVPVNSIQENEISSDYLKERLRESKDILGSSNSNTDKVKNLCQAQKYQHSMRAISECKSADEGKYRSCYQEEIEKESEMGRTFKKAGQILNTLDRAELAIKNQDLGELLGDTPCMAIQGYNGAEGGKDSSFRELDDAILGNGEQRSISR